jgi:restriction endonuclease Mrr
MAVPDFQSFMLPLLQIAGDGKEHTLSELRQRLYTEMKLTEADLEEKLPSGTQTKYVNRVYWSTVYLSKAGALDRVRRGVISITKRGRELLVVELLRLRPIQFCMFLKALFGSGEMERLMSQAISVARAQN